jgi:cell division protease FtsH
MSPLIVIAAILIGFFTFMRFFSQATTNQISLTRFQQLANSGDIVGTVTISDTSITGTFRDSNGQEVPFATPLATNFPTDTLVQDLTAKNIQVTMSTPSPWPGIVGQLLIIGLLVGVMYWLFYRRLGAGGASPLNLGRNKVRMVDRKEMKTTFADVAGVDEAKEELKEVVEFLKTPKKYQRLGGRIPKGVLLLGPPGCGKTLLARAVAGEANVPFFFMSGSEFVEMFVGLGAARVRELFQQAKEKAPALVFLDEIDTIGKGRSGALGAGFGAHDEREQTLNQLLVEMDGFDSSKGVIIMAATNRPDVLDPALVRPGRFDRQVVVDRPDLRGREEILRVHARGVALDPAVDLRTIAARTPGFTGADLENVVNEAALLAARREKNSVTMAELDEAIDRAALGLERKSRVLSPKEKERTAVHEMGHALVAMFSENLDPVHRVTIIPRGTAALGLTWVRPLEDRYMWTEPQLKDQIAFGLGGRAAEEIYYDGVISSGAQDDLQKATSLARAMVADLGMSDAIGPLSFAREDQSIWGPQPERVSQKTAETIDAETTRLINEAHDRARAVLTERRDLLNRLSALLVATEMIEGDDLKAYVDGAKPIPDPETVGAGTTTEEPVTVEQSPAAATAEQAPTRRIVLPPAPPMPTVD